MENDVLYERKQNVLLPLYHIIYPGTFNVKCIEDFYTCPL